MTASNPSSNPLANKSQAWSALFSEPMSELVQRYTASVGFDKRLWRADIDGSLAHARMLAAQSIISPQDLADIERGMAQIAGEIERGEFTWKLELEDVHLNIEARLTELVGLAGKRLHTGRSRNDQVATDVRLWLRAEIDGLTPLLVAMQRALVELAAQHTDTVMPGFTHLQVAQPVSFAHHLLAYVEMFSRDAERFEDARRRINRLPLGSAAFCTSKPCSVTADELVMRVVMSMRKEPYLTLNVSGRIVVPASGSKRSFSVVGEATLVLILGESTRIRGAPGSGVKRGKSGSGAASDACISASVTSSSGCCAELMAPLEARPSAMSLMVSGRRASD
jgi:hypothetical protein